MKLSWDECRLLNRRIHGLCQRFCHAFHSTDHHFCDECMYMYVSTLDTVMCHWCFVICVIKINFVTAWAEKRRCYTSRAARLDTYRAGQTSLYGTCIYCTVCIHTWCVTLCICCYATYPAVICDWLYEKGPFGIKHKSSVSNNSQRSQILIHFLFSSIP